MTGAGLYVKSVEPGSAVARAGVCPGDRLVAIDELVPRDTIDVQLELLAARRVVVQRADGQRVELLTRGERLEPGSLTFVDAVPGGIRECNNHCEFCFIRGLPSGLRSSLYVFDDDYRYSFLWGNFLTLTNLDEADWARIGFQRLTPLNVSVHATDPDIRRRLLSNKHAPDILPQLARLERMGIQINAQVVLCPGFNDGPVLDRTIRDLAALHPSVKSLSVVPVGLTRFSRVRNIHCPTPADARRALDQCERWQTTLRPEFGKAFVYASDELYSLAGRHDVPPASHYDGFPALANGVGLVRSMLDEWHRLLDRGQLQAPMPRKLAWLTGPLAAPALARMADEWSTRTGWRPDVVAVPNTLFGERITVSGLLTGRDLISTLKTLPADLDDIVLPRGPFGFDGQSTLDGLSAETVGAAHPARVHLAATPRELLKILTSQRE